MPVSLSIKNVPDELAERLRARAKRNHRSLQGELLALLEERELTENEPPAPLGGKEAFLQAAGGWKGLVDTDALLKDFRKSRKVRSPEVRL